MNEILLEDILQLNKYSSRVKVRFNQYNGHDDPMEVYKANLAEENKKKNAITPNKLINTINTINNAGYEVQSIKDNAINIIKGF